jgi:hypothetical protein
MRSGGRAMWCSELSDEHLGGAPAVRAWTSRVRASVQGLDLAGEADVGSGS